VQHCGAVRLQLKNLSEFDEKTAYEAILECLAAIYNGLAPICVSFVDFIDAGWGRILHGVDGLGAAIKGE